MSPSIISTSNIKNSTILQKVKRLKRTYINHQDSTYMEFGVNWVSTWPFWITRKFILKVAVSQKTLVAVTELVEAFLLSLFLR